MSEVRNPSVDLGDAIETLEVVRDMIYSTDPEIRAYAVSISKSVTELLGAIYLAEMDVRFNKERQDRY